jgi:hypothetical protein
MVVSPYQSVSVSLELLTLFYFMMRRSICSGTMNFGGRLRHSAADLIIGLSAPFDRDQLLRLKIFEAASIGDFGEQVS